ncbi:MAG: hypothetical protein C0508_30140 [Cyanobacteria bacterium PR.023]|nr:hypothetical protein [Cyanobacteria bacterium PR.023]
MEVNLSKREANEDQSSDSTSSSGRKIRRVVDMIGSSIANGQYKPEETLPTELILCENLNVGRNVLREGLKILAGKGLVRTVRRAGTSILPQSDWNMLDPDILAWTLETKELRTEMLCELARLRRIIEPEVAALAAINATTTEMLRLFECYEGMKKFDTDPRLAIEFDIQFHQRMFEAAHSPLLSSLLRGFIILYRANFEITINSGYVDNLIQHRLIAEAIRDRKPEVARTSMITLLTNNDASMAQLIGSFKSNKS